MINSNPRFGLSQHRAKNLSAAHKDSDISAHYKFNMAVAGDGEDDDPDPTDSRTDIFRVCVPADATLHQDTSASSTYLGNQAGNTNMVEDILVGRSGAGSWLALMSTWSPGEVQTHFLVSIPTALSSSQDSSASSTYLGNQAGNTFMVEDLLMGAEWWWDTAWVVVYIEHGLRVLLHPAAVLVFSTALRGLTASIQLHGQSPRSSIAHERAGSVVMWRPSKVAAGAGNRGSFEGESANSMGGFGGKGAVGTEQTRGSREGSCRLSQESTRPLGTRHEAVLSILTF